MRRKIPAIPQRTSPTHLDVRLPNQYEIVKRVVSKINPPAIAMGIYFERGRRKKPLAA
jgi:hypothetical protein